MKTSHQQKKIILALGNPGEEFENTYHNAGMMALPAIVRKLTDEDISTLEWKKYKGVFEYAEGKSQITNHKSQIIFIKPLTYMNESGIAAAEALKKFGATAENLIVIHDDSDITLGDYKISFDRSSGGHKGAQSIIDHLKTQTFTRVRIGVRPSKESKRQKAGDFVLKKITASGRKIWEKIFEESATALHKNL